MSMNNLPTPIYNPNPEQPPPPPPVPPPPPPDLQDLHEFHNLMAEDSNKGKNAERKY